MNPSHADVAFGFSLQRLNDRAQSSFEIQHAQGDAEDIDVLD
jgi:hypothetical protein